MKLFLIFMFLLMANLQGRSQCNTPSNHPTGFTINDKQKKSLSCSFTAATGAEAPTSYLVLRSKSNTAPAAPVDGTTYTVGQSYSAAETVVSVSNSTSFTADQLDAGTPYFFYIYSGQSGSGCIKYNGTPLTGSESTADEEVEDKKSGAASSFSPLLDFNFAGKKNTWTNFTPAVYYGWTLSGNAKHKRKAGGKKNVTMWTNTFQVGPYIGTTISIQDSTSYLPAIMLPGNAGLTMNYFLTLFPKKKFNIEISPVNLGLKVVSGFTDSSISIVQYSVRHFIGFQFSDFLSASFQYTTGWHNATSFSQEQFRKIFNVKSTRVSYWNLGLTTRITKDLLTGKDKETPLYFSINCRSFVKPKGSYGLPNARFITVGLATNLNLKSGANSGHVPHAPQR